MDWCVQLSKAALDVHPGNVFTLPPELDPLGEQRLAGQLAVCAGLGCPQEALWPLLPMPQLSAGRRRAIDRFATEKQDDKRPPDKPPRPPVTVPTRKLECFCLEADLVAGADFVGPAGDEHFRGILGGLEIVDLAPQGMEDAIECYAKLVVTYGVLAQAQRAGHQVHHRASRPRRPGDRADAGPISRRSGSKPSFVHSTPTGSAGRYGRSPTTG
jgi:hypothetical protein